MALTAKVSRTFVGSQDEISGVLTASDIFYAGGILSFSSGKLTNAATAASQAIAGIFTGITDDGDRTDAYSAAAANTVKGIVQRGKVWLPMTGAAQTDVGGFFVGSGDDLMVAAPPTAAAEYVAYIALDFKTGYLLFDLRAPIHLTNPA